MTAGLLLALLLAQTPAPEAPPADSEPAPAPAGEHGLGEEVITGQVDVKIDDANFLFTPQINPFGPIEDLLTPETYVFDGALYRTVDSLTIPSQFVRSSYLRVPVQKDFTYGDIMVFLPTFESRVATWELLISNSLGEAVRRVRRDGQPPAMMSWDGRTDDGEAIVTGESYSFTFNAYDAQGNQTRIPGEPQRINGMVYQDGDEWVVSMAADQVFQPGSAVLADGSGARLDEAANIIKEHYRREVVIYVYTEQERISADRCAVLEAETRGRVVLPDGALKVAPRFIPGLQAKFSKIEIRIL